MIRTRVNGFQSLVKIIENDFDFAIPRYPNIGTILKHEISVVGCHSAPEIDSSKNRTSLVVHDPTFIQYAALLGKTRTLLEMIKVAKAQGLTLKQIFEPSLSNTKITVLNLIVYSGQSQCLNEVLAWLKKEDRQNTITANFTGTQMHSPLSIAVDVGSPEIVDLLLNTYKADPLLNADKMACPLIRAISNAKGCKQGTREQGVLSLMYTWIAKHCDEVKNLKWAKWKLDDAGRDLIAFLQGKNTDKGEYNHIIGKLGELFKKEGSDWKAIEQDPTPEEEQHEEEKHEEEIHDAKVCSACGNDGETQCDGCDEWFCASCYADHNC